MVRINFERDEVSGDLTLTPPAAADFMPVTLYGDVLNGEAEISLYQASALHTLRSACGNIECRGILPIETEDTPAISGAVRVIGCAVECAVSACPLDVPPPSAGDRSPLEPYSPPSLAVSADIPVSL